MKNLMICFIAIFIFSCDYQDNLNPKIEFGSFNYDPVLQDVALIVSEISVDRDIQKEILSFGTKENDGEVKVSFKQLFYKNTENGRINSTFAEKFRKIVNSENGSLINFRISSNSELLEEYLINGNYYIYAPYYAENFEISETPITISWWNGIDTTGITPGILWDENLSSKTLNQSAIIVDDNYASSHPTWVIMPMEESTENLENDILNAANGRVAATQRDINCNDLSETDVIELRMPSYRLHGNTRGWPRDNRLYLWVGVGKVTFINGIPQISPDVYLLWNGKSVSRSNAKKENWLNSDISFFISGWKKENVDAYFVFGYQKANKNLIQEMVANVEVKSDGSTTTQVRSTSKTIDSKDTNLIVATSLGKCSYLADYTKDGGYGTINGFRIYRFNNISFYLQPVLK